MRIRCYFHKEYIPKAPFVKTLICIPELNAFFRIDFLIDTGSSTTTLLARDINENKIDLKKLRKSDRNLCGVGGRVDTYFSDNVDIYLKCEEGGYYHEKMRLEFGKHKTEEFDKETRELLESLPSLLGRDIQEKFIFYCDYEKEEVYLETKGM